MGEIGGNTHAATARAYWPTIIDFRRRRGRRIVAHTDFCRILGTPESCRRNDLADNSAVSRVAVHQSDRNTLAQPAAFSKWS
jgi:hypothetical protein